MKLVEIGQILAFIGTDLTSASNESIINITIALENKAYESSVLGLT